jgi:UDP-3-O-[3-hydroxymyristoyl] glucosamine N-acyltransferase
MIDIYLNVDEQEVINSITGARIISFIERNSIKVNFIYGTKLLIKETENSAFVNANNQFFCIESYINQRLLTVNKVKQINLIDPSSKILSLISEKTKNVFIDYDCFVDHGVVLGNMVHLGKGVTIGRNVKIEDGVIVSDNAIIQDNVILGKFSYIGFGMKISENVKAYSILEKNIDSLKGFIQKKNGIEWCLSGLAINVNHYEF